MKMDFNNFFGKKGKIYLGVGALALVLLVGGGIFVNSQLQAKRQEELRIAEEKAKEEKEKAEEIAKAEEEKKAKELEEKKLAEERAKKEQEEKEKAKKEKEEKEKESGKAKVDERESKGYNGQSENKVVNNKTTSNSNNKNTNTNSKKNNNSNSNNNSNNKNTNTFEVEDDENTYPPIGNSGMFFATQQEAWNYASNDTTWFDKGYNRYWVGRCKHNGKIGWTVNFRK